MQKRSNPADYDTFYEIIFSSVESHDMSIPLRTGNQRIWSIHVTSGDDEIESTRMERGERNHWTGLSAHLHMEPQRKAMICFWSNLYCLMQCKKYGRFEKLYMMTLLHYAKREQHIGIFATTGFKTRIGLHPGKDLHPKTTGIGKEYPVKTQWWHILDYALCFPRFSLFEW